MIKYHHWGPNPLMLARAEELARKAGGLIVEVGPGFVPFAPATTFVDRAEGSNLPAPGKARTWFAVDVSREPLPFQDKEVSFLYARHVLEDLADPSHFLREVNRVAKAGYIETPSPVAELCRGVDGSKPPWRGYHHHRSICWVDGFVLQIAAKYPIVEISESFGAGRFEDLNAGPLHWNTYVFWNGDLEWKLLEHDVDFKVWDGSYERILGRAIELSLERNDRLAEVLAQRAAKPAPELTITKAMELEAMAELDKPRRRPPAPSTPVPEVQSPQSSRDTGAGATQRQPYLAEFYDNGRYGWKRTKDTLPNGRRAKIPSFGLMAARNDPDQRLLAQRWWVDVDILVGGSILDQADLDHLRNDFGVRTVLSLDDYEIAGVDTAKLRDHWLPTHDDGRPKPAAWWYQGVEIGMKFFSEVQAGTPGVLYIHCGMGQSRSPAMAYAILRAQGYTRETARDRLLRGVSPSGPHPSMDTIAPYLASFEEWFAGRRGR